MDFVIIRNVGFKFILLLSVFCMTEVQAKNELDLKLEKYITAFRFEPVNKLPGMNRARYNLGKSLFSNRLLSTKSNISCMSSDALRYFSISGRIMMSSGQRFLAIAEAIAE